MHYWRYAQVFFLKGFIVNSLLLLIVFIVLANLPWITERALLVFPLNEVKSVWIRLVELIVFYVVALLIAIAAEIQFSGEVSPQHWEFFTTTICMFLVFSVVGVVYRYQWPAMKQKAN